MVAEWCRGFVIWLLIPGFSLSPPTIFTTSSPSMVAEWDHLVVFALYPPVPSLCCLTTLKPSIINACPWPITLDLSAPVYLAHSPLTPYHLIFLHNAQLLTLLAFIPCLVCKKWQLFEIERARIDGRDSEMAAITYTQICKANRNRGADCMLAMVLLNSEDY